MKEHPEIENTKYYYKAILQYDGTGYAGFQWQKDIPSIQNDFNQAIASLIQGKITTMGASRTDTGVHALKQVVKITSENPIDCPTTLGPLNLALPSQIRCLGLEACSSHFKPANDPISKEYRYYFTNIRNVEQLDRRFIANFSLPLDIELMRKCLHEILGIHDFQNFCSAGSNVKSTVREINLCELTEINPHTIFGTSELFKVPLQQKSCYQLRIEGNGFLKQMIRHLVSSLWMVGSGRLTINEFIVQLKGPKREKRIWKVASPSGLYLYEIKYS
jgi:tRNA pseudouridine38-40 synthase